MALNLIQKINSGHYFNFFTIIGMKKHVVLSIYRLKMCLCSAPGHRDILICLTNQISINISAFVRNSNHQKRISRQRYFEVYPLRHEFIRGYPLVN